jgi:hypothetical protein
VLVQNIKQTTRAQIKQCSREAKHNKSGEKREDNKNERSSGTSKPRLLSHPSLLLFFSLSIFYIYKLYHAANVFEALYVIYIPVYNDPNGRYRYKILYNSSALLFLSISYFHAN